MSDLDRIVEEIEQKLNKRFPYPQEGITIEAKINFYEIRSNTVEGCIELILDSGDLGDLRAMVNIFNKDNQCIDFSDCSSQAEIVQVIAEYWARNRKSS